MPNQSPHMPKFGDWDVDGEKGGQQAFTLIFENMRSDKSMKGVNPNDPAFIANYLNSSSSSSPPSQAVVRDADAPPPPPSLHQSPSPPLHPNSRLSMNQKNQSPCVPKFGEWDLNGENGGEQAFTVIFDNMRTDKSMKRVNPNDPAFLAEMIKSSSQAAVHGVSQLPPLPLQHASPRSSPLKPTSRVSMNHKQVMAPKFGNWDVEHPKEYTAIFDDLKQEKRHRHASAHRPQTSTFPTTPLPPHKPFLTSWRLCFSSGGAVRD